MRRFLSALAAATAMTVAVPATTIANEQVVIVDAPDVQKLAPAVGGARLSAVIGTDVYSNSGKRIGEIEDFTVSNGHLYAVIDIQESGFEEYVDLSENDVVVVPWDELRVMDRPE